jgi:6-pyruvoyltetrahydropterin/6-carboxytetrahydropterin synthase
VEVTATELDNVGMGLDFKTIRQAAKEVAGTLDHHYLNELSPFTEINPTAENIARHFFSELGGMLNNNRVKVSAVTIWETERANVRYSED